MVPLAVFTTNPDGAAIVQTIGPLKTLSGNGAGATAMPSQRYLIVTEMHDPSHVVLRQASASTH
jgi:hypothetical protein